MRKTTRRNLTEQEKEAVIREALRTGGFLFPQTIDEVKEFERIYGKTDLILPSELQDPAFLHMNRGRSAAMNIRKGKSENFAVAAREGAKALPTEIQKRILNDIRKSESRKRREGSDE